MSMISEQVKELRTFGAMSVLDMIEPEILRKQLSEAADTIETLSAKLQAANMERSTAYYNGGWILCSDRLPTKDECGDFGKSFNVTAYTNKPETMTMKFEYETIRGKEVCRWKWFERLSPWEVIAWRELPEPYKPQ